MLSSINWFHVIRAALAGFAISMIFYSLPIMQKYRREQSQTGSASGEAGIRPGSFTSAILARLLNTFLYCFMLAWFLTLTGITTLGMGLILMLVVMLRSALTADGWNGAMRNQPRAIRFVDRTRFILMHLIMTGMLILWR